VCSRRARCTFFWAPQRIERPAAEFAPAHGARRTEHAAIEAIKMAMKLATNFEFRGWILMIDGAAGQRWTTTVTAG